MWDGRPGPKPLAGSGGLCGQWGRRASESREEQVPGQAGVFGEDAWGLMLSGAGAGCGEGGMPPNQFHSLPQGPPGPSTLLSPGHLSHLNPDSWLEARAAHRPVVAHICGPSV